ncbi:MAG: bifunctional glutamate N-acetyltransferase/amino-acid acetyltransferase ArgJ [Chloroflexota bacterium]|nr:bifunctional glutamate N-acetyltransferase/amino-acid acetyltransferase ArgJ [Dehalococcoidia bacterium]MDW8254667.1 bifunctional glutamate N-acetyltransferase/amino-acid acetyltransferase ArgJ [Chloroflexota bacterium]
MELIPDGSVTSPRGFIAGGIAAGIKPSGALDLGILASVVPATAAAVFTTHALPSPTILLNRERVARGTARAIVVNSGNANAATGAAGLHDAQEMARLAAARLGIPETEALAASTGVIGIPLPMDLVRAAIPAVPLSPEGGHDFARAIMTTDSWPKERAVRLVIDGRTVTVGGCAKGAGMIHPNLATMLAFLTTDAPVTASWLSAALRRIVDDTFNMIDVDGDMSTNDTVLVLANGEAGGTPIAGGPAGDALEAALRAVAEHLAKEIVRNAEGATKLIEVRVTGAPSRHAARAIARTVASSLMVTTAVHGNDPNWGRIYGAIGNAGVPVNADRLSIAIGAVQVFAAGAPRPFDATAAIAHLHGPDVLIAIDLGEGTERATAWGSNLSEAYVTLNSVYTT